MDTSFRITLIEYICLPPQTGCVLLHEPNLCEPTCEPYIGMRFPWCCGIIFWHNGVILELGCFMETNIAALYQSGYWNCWILFQKSNIGFEYNRNIGNQYCRIIPAGNQCCLGHLRLVQNLIQTIKESTGLPIIYYNWASQHHLALYFVIYNTENSVPNGAQL